ncbi:MAG: GNAT family N-acetyltransferase [Bacilli bacterium]|nr:GNAT family N-acetyltransferase [Bacilli bacterium]
MKFKYVIPTIEYKDKAIDYIKEFIEYKSDINGSGGLDRYLDNYEGWLEYREESRNHPITDTRVPGEEYFMVNEDDEIIGMCNIRFALNDKLKKLGGHIGYSIRPTKRGNGYNKINLYLALKECDKHGINVVFMDADLNNPASWKTMEALGGVRVKEWYDDERYKTTIVDYNINVKESLEKYKEEYEKYLIKGMVI